MKSAICLTVRNEHQDIAEWVAHYTALGADQLIIYDDASNDGTTALLKRLSSDFPIRLIEWQTSDPARQNAAYTHCIKNFGHEFDWIGFLDADEFLIPQPGESLPDFLERYHIHDAIAINWLTFGTSGVLDTNGALITETLTHRAEENFGPNHHVKIFVRPSAFEKVINPHYFKGPQNWADANGDPVVWGTTPGVTQDVVTGEWRLHHYVLRSEAHWERRQKRMRANGGAPRDEGFFTNYDRNDIEDRTALPFAQVTRSLLQKTKFLKTQPIHKAEQTPLQLANNHPPVVQSIHLVIDELGPHGARGWALNKLKNTKVPLQLRCIVDDNIIALVSCSDARPDLEKAGLKDASGFSFVLPKEIFDGQDHKFVFQTLEGQIVPMRIGHEQILERVVNQSWHPKITGHIEGFNEADQLKGWVFQEEEGVRTGGLTVAITCNGHVIGETVANVPRADVAGLHKFDSDCGFVFDIPSEFQKNTSQDFGAHVVPHGVHLSPPVAHTFTESNLALTGIGNWTLDNYPTWSWLHQQTLLNSYNNPPSLDAPLVSIICPVYRPQMGDFVKAVESVLEQTYPNWELILVDDHSRQADLSACLKAYEKRDPRITVIRQKKNEGIAAATNTGLEAARGRWVALFDHDDALSPVALTAMVKKGKETDALLIYSDEDKVGPDGTYRDPAFKPDWNYRYLLGVNYICHFVMVDREALIQIGGIPTGYDGAQDHAMLLRLSEIVPSERIAHVPEILYHWRITANSTAGGIGAKPYAIAAGQRAIEDHLVRRGIEGAKVSNIANMTWYEVEWSFTNEPKVCIIIPFKDRADLTWECLRRIQKTEYGNFEVILVDNNSEHEETFAFCAEAVKDPRVRVMRVEEPFNYSRLNNLAAKKTNAAYLVLMNNDLHVDTDGKWLRTMVNEATADENVGIVGGKFLYPNPADGVQHAGVVTGIGGVACHIHGGLQPNDPGFGARALVAQELSVVTAACLMVNRKLYWEVGGLDEEKLAVAFNDVDLCLGARAKGAKVIWAPAFKAVHHESVSRGSDITDPTKAARFAREASFMQEKWGDTLGHDPHYSRFFRLDVGTAFTKLISPTRDAATTLPAPLLGEKWCHG